MATLTIRNVPDDLYERLKALAKRNRRSLNQEVVVQLESAAEPATATQPPAAFLRDLDQWRAALGKRDWPTAEEVDAMIDEGRE